MTDLPPQPPAIEQVIEQKLVECGLNRAGLTVAYSSLLQGIEIVIGPKAGASTEQFQCIHDAATSEFVMFEDHELYLAYSDFESELARPRVLEMTRNELVKRSLMEGFPERKDFSSDDAFAEALEVHCGLEPKSAIGRTEFGLIFLPSGVPPLPFKGERYEQWSCLLTAIRYASARGDSVKVGLVGNEAVQEPESK